jgi:hypothetical protein
VDHWRVWGRDICLISSERAGERCCNEEDLKHVVLAIRELRRRTGDGRSIIVSVENSRLVVGRWVMGVGCGVWGVGGWCWAGETPQNWRQNRTTLFNTFSPYLLLYSITSHSS